MLQSHACIPYGVLADLAGKKYAIPSLHSIQCRCDIYRPNYSVRCISAHFLFYLHCVYILSAKVENFVFNSKTFYENVFIIFNTQILKYYVSKV